MSDTQSEFETLQMPDTFLADMFKTQLVLIDGEQFAKKQAPTLPPAKKVPAPQDLVAEKPKNIILPPTPPKPAPAPAPAPTPAAATIPEPPTAWSNPPHAFLGKFKKQVLILLHDDQAVHINEANLAFLSKIIASVGISLEHIALLNTYGKNVDYASLKHQFPATVAIYFGIEPASLGVPMKFPHFQVQQWDHCSFLTAPSLEKLNGSSPEQTEMKKQLWTSLKKIFS